MTGKELRNLQESYFEMYNPERLDEGFKTFPHEKVQKQANKKPSGRSTKGIVGEIQFDRMIDKAADFKDKEWGPRLEKQARDREAANRARGAANNRVEGGRQRLKDKNRVPKKVIKKDMFEHILEHLVSEGYADTEEAAIVIMANMSEEWIDSIVG
jgi:hypothetical protein